MIVAFVCLILFSICYIGWVAYRVGFWKGGLEGAVVKARVRTSDRTLSPNTFFTVKLETEPETWCTIEDLGIVLIRNEYSDRYDAYVVTEHEDRALAWMRQASMDWGGWESPVVKYENEFYRFSFFHGTYWSLGSIHSLAVVPLLFLAAVWGIFALGAYLSHKQRTPMNQE